MLKYQSMVLSRRHGTDGMNWDIGGIEMEQSHGTKEPYTDPCQIAIIQGRYFTSLYLVCLAFL